MFLFHWTTKVLKEDFERKKTLKNLSASSENAGFENATGLAKWSKFVDF